MIKLQLSNANYKWIANQINPKCEPEMVMAFNNVECKREPFDVDGFPAILYERHVVYNSIYEVNVKKAIDLSRKYPSLIYPTGYGPGGYGSYASQRTKLAQCIAILQKEGLSTDHAYEGCSYGAYQELGINWKNYGFTDVNEFVETMKNGLYGQCTIFVKSMRHRNLILALINHQFVPLARGYNGKGYAKFHYDTQLESEWKKAKNRGIDWEAVIALPPTQATTISSNDYHLPEVNIEDHEETEEHHVSPDIQAQSIETNEEENTPTTPTNTEQTPNTKVEVKDGDVKVETNAEVKTPEKVAVIAKESRLKYFWHKITGMVAGNGFLDGVFEKAGQVQALGLPSSFWSNLIWFTIAGCLIAIIVLVVKDWQDKHQTLRLAQENSTPDNKVTIAKPEDVDTLKANGYKIVQQDA